jgi:hypothetical protein
MEEKEERKRGEGQRQENHVAPIQRGEKEGRERRQAEGKSEGRRERSKEGKDIIKKR